MGWTSIAGTGSGFVIGCSGTTGLDFKADFLGTGWSGIFCCSIGSPAGTSTMEWSLAFAKPERFRIMAPSFFQLIGCKCGPFVLIPKAPRGRGAGAGCSACNGAARLGNVEGGWPGLPKARPIRSSKDREARCERYNMEARLPSELLGRI